MLSPDWPWTRLILALALVALIALLVVRAVSRDRGDSWSMISPDLTMNTNRDTMVTMGLKGSDIHISRDDGISQYPTIVSLAESPKQPGLYYTGSEDGLVYVSKDGKNWTNITKNMPGFPTGAFISEVVPSKYDAGTVYVTVDNHRLNDYAPHMWVSTDFGATFHSIVNNLRGENAHHQCETVFKAFARALRMAVAVDPRLGNVVPSTKGSL